MALLDRLRGWEYPQIPVHQFWASMVEYAKSQITVADIKTYFDMSAEDQDDFDWLIGKYDASSNKPAFIELMHVIFLLAEIEFPGYDTKALLVTRVNGIG